MLQTKLLASSLTFGFACYFGMNEQRVIFPVLEGSLCDSSQKCAHLSLSIDAILNVLYAYYFNVFEKFVVLYWNIKIVNLCPYIA